MIGVFDRGQFSYLITLFQIFTSKFYKKNNLEAYYLIYI